EAGNVVSVTSIGDTIHGTLKTEVRYPPEEKPPPDASAPAKALVERLSPQSSRPFQTQRPVFADPGLEALLESKGVMIDARDESVPSWLNLLIGFGPTLLLIAAFVWLSRRAAAGGGGV